MGKPLSAGDFALPRSVLSPRDVRNLCHVNMGTPYLSIEEELAAFLKEDAGAGDAAFLGGLNPTKNALMFIVAKEDFVLCGVFLMAVLFQLSLGEGAELFCDVKDGDLIKKGQVVLGGRGHPTGFLLAERSALNLASRLSGIATKTRQFTELLHSHSSSAPTLLETRKTTPGLRRYEKYATRVGGARNHRHGLDSGVMLKENHLRTTGLSLRDSILAVKKGAPALVKIEVEVGNLDELSEALGAQPDVIMLDNFSQADVTRAVELRNKTAPQILLEVSGNMDKADPQFIANCGVDFVSVGALIHGARSVDMSLQLFGANS